MSFLKAAGISLLIVITLVLGITAALWVGTSGAYQIICDWISQHPKTFLGSFFGLIWMVLTFGFYLDRVHDV